MKLKLIGTRKEAGNAKSFIFEPQQPLMWVAGQFMHYGLPRPHDIVDTMERFFTISSAPHTGTPQITTRVSKSEFKQALNSLKIGDSIDARMPEGDFVWKDSERPIVFIAGGIGITPFHSIIAERAHLGLPINATLVYANRDDQVIFKDELDAIAKTHPELTVKYVIGHPFDFDRLVKTAPDLSNSLIYISGAEPMVEEISHLLDEKLKIADSQLIKDFFPGYTHDTF